ncbi:MAG: CopG family ribbon-helix-helix protein [Thaumarchaeota archaeon]|nr:CopG family ribbon-helix-helix protein [Nitrososphaerota archaeon]
MPIISISLNDEILLEIDRTQKTLGFSGRSELIRSAVRSFLAETKNMANISGRMNAILLATHDQSAEDVVTKIKHSFDDAIVTHTHSKLDSGKCLETFTLLGEAERIDKMFRALQVSRKVDYVKLVLA